MQLSSMVCNYVCADFQDTSLPCAAFVWGIENKTSDQLEVSITLSFCSGQGGKATEEEGGAWSEAFDHHLGETRATGVTMHQTFR